MLTEAERARSLAEVLGARVNREPVVGEPVGHRKSQRKRIAGLRMQHQAERHGVGRALARLQRLPAYEPVNGASHADVVDRQLVMLAAVLVGAVLDPVRPRRQHLAATGLAQFVRGVPVEHFALADRVAAQAAADLHDRRALVAVPKLELLAGRVHRAADATAWRRAGVSSPSDDVVPRASS